MENINISISKQVTKSIHTHQNNLSIAHYQILEEIMPEFMELLVLLYKIIIKELNLRLHGQEQSSSLAQAILFPI